MTKTLDPATGPIPRDKFQELVSAPFGEAAKAIRNYDPQWGRAEGEKFEWKVQVQRCGSDEGYAIIKAASQDEADAMADDLDESDISWDDYSQGFEVISVQPNKVR